MIKKVQKQILQNVTYSKCIVNSDVIKLKSFTSLLDSNSQKQVLKNEGTLPLNPTGHIKQGAPHKNSSLVHAHLYVT